MLRPYHACLLLLLFSCKSSELPEHQTLAAQPLLLPKESDAPTAPAAPPPVREPRCKAEDLPKCPADDTRLPYRCTAYRYGGKLLATSRQLLSWGENPCEAKKNLYREACDAKLDPEQMDSVSCVPTANIEKCSETPKSCPKTEKPTRCYARSYKDIELDLTSRPQAWGRNECEARQNLERIACRKGLEEDEFGRIVCEAEPSPQLCPPQWTDCPKEDDYPAQCSLTRIGSSLLKKPLKTIGTTACEARYRMQDLACRYGSTANHLTKEDLGSMACLGLDQPKTPPAIN